MANQSFKEAYDVLQHHAQTLRDQPEPNIDDLLTLVTEAVGAYKVCRARIDAVESVLEKAESDTAVAPKEPLRAVKTQPPEVFDAFETLPVQERDIPFFRLLVQPQLRAAINRFN